MGIKNPFQSDHMGNSISPDALVDKMIGTAYTAVKLVHDNLQYIKHVSINIEQIAELEINAAVIQKAAEDIKDLVNINEKIPELNAIGTALTKLDAIYQNLAYISNVNANMPDIVNINNNIEEVVVVGENITSVVIVSQDISSVLTVAQNIEKISLAYDGALKAAEDALEAAEKAEQYSEISVNSANNSLNSANTALAEANRITGIVDIFNEEVTQAFTDLDAARIAAMGNLNVFDTLEQANSNLEIIPDNTGVSVLADGANSGFYVRQGAVLIKKSSSTLVTVAAFTTFAEKILSATPQAEVAYYLVDKFDGLIGKVMTDGTLIMRNLSIGQDEIRPDISAHDGVAYIQGTEIQRIDSLGNSVTFQDSNGNVTGHFGSNGVYLYGSDVHGQKLSGGLQDVFSVKGESIKMQGTPIDKGDGAGLTVTDKYGYIITYSGVYGSYNFNAANETVAKDQYEITDTLGYQQNTTYKCCISYGQSLSRGTQALPLTSVTQPYLNVTLNGGSKARFGIDARYDASSFKPLVEEIAGTEGESPLSSCLNAVTRRAISEGGTAEEWKFFGAATGAGGRTAYQLSKDDPSTAWFSATVKLVKDANALALSRGETFSMWSILWLQGEADYTSSSFDKKPNAYQQRFLNSIWEPLVSQIKEITKQKFDPYVFSYQVAAHRRYSRDDMPIALAQWRMSKALPMYCLAAPCYMFQSASDNLHLTSLGSWLIGQYMARAKHQTMVKRSGKFRPLEPETVTWGNDTVKIKFHVPNGKLALDTVLTSSTPNFGFDIRNSSDVLIADAIQSVVISGDNEITVNLKTGLPKGLTLTYARGRIGDPAHSGPVTGARGNLRDTAGDFDVAIHPETLVEYPMHNACVMFEHNQINGF